MAVAASAAPRWCWLAVLWSVAAPAFAGDVTGVVFEDANGNGARDLQEPGLPGVAVSNGRRIVRTGPDGTYGIAAAAGDIVYAIKPAGRDFALRGDGLPDFWQAASAGPRFDIALSPVRVLEAPRDILVFADPQVKSPVDVGYYRDDIVAPLRGTTAVLGLSLGDIVDDEPSLYPAINAVTASLGVPWLHVAGNHDVDGDPPGDAGSLATFRRTFGPETVAWEEPEATFIGLDDVVAMPGQRPAYVGGLRQDQFAFLEAYLPTVRKDRLLVLAVHIPFFDSAAPGAAPTFRTADRARLFALLRDFPHVLLLSGHSHQQQHYFHGEADGWQGRRPLHEYNVGAACGAYWSGVADAAGIPASTMGDGTPNGYAVLTLEAGGAYGLAWHAARDPQDAQIGLHAPKVLRRGAYPAWGVYANVYMGFEGGVVEYRIDGGEWRPMRQVRQADPALLVENMRDDLAEGLRGFDRSPEAEPSAHLWRAALATDLGVGDHAIEVRYLDPWRGEQRAATRYRLEEPTP